MKPALPVARALAVAVVAVLAGCAATAGGSERSAPAGPAAPEASVLPAAPDIRLALGGTTTVEGGALEIAFVELVSDSRCARGETCVWEGDAVIRLAVRSGADAASLELHTAARGPRVAGFAGWRIELVALEPAPVAGKPATQAPVATLAVARGGAPENALQ